MKKLITVSLFLVLTAILVGWRLVAHDADIGREFYNIAPGTPKRIVLERLGKPSSASQKCENSEFWLDDTITKVHCIEEIRYNALLMPKYWTLGFNKNGDAILKYEYVSS